VNGAGASDGLVSVGHAAGTALDADPDDAPDGGQGASALLDGGQGTPAAGPGSGGALLTVLPQDVLRAMLEMLDGGGLEAMLLVNPAFRPIALAEIAERNAEALAAADRCKDALTDAEARAVAAALCAPPRAVVSDGFDAQVTGDDAARLNPGGWLNDVVINFEMALLQDRDDRRCAADPTLKPCYVFNSFFLAKLMGPDAQSYS